MVAIAVMACFAAGGASAGERNGAPVTTRDLQGSAYIEQIDAPTDWMIDKDYWLETDSLVVVDLTKAPHPDQIVIADRGNSASQTQSGIGHQAFIFQWGTGNMASQRQVGSLNRAEAVQVSPGAMISGRADSGAGNGAETDVFGFEFDPGKSGRVNKAPEPRDGDSGVVPSEGNTLNQVQTGSGNMERAVQIGWLNQASQVQEGSSNVSIVIQLGQHNSASSEQDGDENVSVIAQRGTGNSATVRQ